MAIVNQPVEPMVVRIPTSGPTINAQIWNGNGPLLLLIHGIGSSGHSWNNVIGDLRVNFSPVTIDLRGHGESDKPASGYLYDDYVTDLDHVIAYLGLDPILIIGHSLGGIITLWWAARHPEAAAALVAEDSPLRSGKAFLPMFDTWIRLNAMESGDLRAHYAHHNPAWTSNQLDDRTRTMRQTAPAVFSELRADSLANHGVDRIGELTGITSPALLVHGDLATGSSVVPSDANAFRTRLPNAEVVRIAHGPHALHRENREAFLKATLPFLRRNAGNH